MSCPVEMGGLRGPHGVRLLSSRQLSTTAIRSILVRAVGPASSFVLAVILARSLGAAGSGVFFVALTLVTALAILSKFGLETAIQRFVGAATVQGGMAAVTQIHRQSSRMAVALAVAVCAASLALAPTFAEAVLHDARYTGMLRVLGMLVVPYTMLGIDSALLKAIGKPAWGGFFETAAWPAITLGLAGVIIMGGTPTVHTIAIIYVVAVVFAAVTARRLVRASLPHDPRPLPLPPRSLFESCIRLASVELVNYALLWAPFVLLPALADATQAGLYSVAHRLAAQLGLLMLVLASITSARFAAQYRQRELRDLATLAGRATRTMTVLGLPPALALLLFADPILALFGAEFTAGSASLRVLLVGQLVNLATGPVGHILAMTGHERLLRNVLLASASIMLLLALVLVPMHGALGAATAAAAVMVFHNLACSYLVARRLGLPFFLALAR